MKLTQEEKNIKICEALGWRRPDDPLVMRFKEGWTMPEKWWMCPDGVLRFKHDMPNYFTDLNACHEMEVVLTDHQQMMMNHELKRRSRKTNIPAWRATAAQRAEAFGLTLNLWKPGE